MAGMRFIRMTPDCVTVAPLRTIDSLLGFGDLLYGFDVPFPSLDVPPQEPCITIDRPDLRVPAVRRRESNMERTSAGEEGKRKSAPSLLQNRVCRSREDDRKMTDK